MWVHNLSSAVPSLVTGYAKCVIQALLKMNLISRSICTLVGRWFESPAVPKTKSQNRSGEDDGRLVLSVVLHQLQSQRSSTFLPTRIHHLEVPQPRSRSFKTDLKTFSNYNTGFPVSLGLLHRITFPSQIKSVVLLEKLAILRWWIKTIFRWSRKIQGLLLCRQDSDSDSDLLSLRCTAYVHTCERHMPRSSNTITSAKTWWKYTIKTLKQSAGCQELLHRT